MAGTAREMIGRSPKALEENGAIRLDHHRISIADKESPRKMAGAAASENSRERSTFSHAYGSTTNCLMAEVPSVI